MVMPSRSFWKGRRVLLTGHTGFKGSWTALWLEALGAHVTGLSLAPCTGSSLWSALGRPGGMRIGDIRDPATVQAAFAAARPEIVIHMAAQALVHPSYKNPADTFDTNVMGLVRILDACRQASDLRAIVNVTSDKCYENVEQLWAYREDERMGGSDPYSASKGCAELVTASYRNSFFKPTDGAASLASGRAGNVIGGGDWARDRLIPDCIRSWLRGEPVSIRNAFATRPWQHVLEPISGYLVLAQALAEKGSDVAEGWNFGPSDNDIWDVGRVVAKLASLWGPAGVWQQDSGSWPKEAKLLRVDATKARFRLGWSSRLTVDEALTWTVDWYRGATVNSGNGRDIALRQIADYEALSANPQ